MNCEVCDLKFERLKDVMRHCSIARHRCISFFCIPCALSLPSVADVVEHVASKEHCITALATGIRLDTNGSMLASFPAHNCCFLCSSRDGTLDNNHLKTDGHRYMAWLLRKIISSKKIFCTNSQACPLTRGFISKMINAKRNTPLDSERIPHKLRDSLRYTCELCNLHFVHREYLDQHLIDGSHKRMEEFLIKISLIADEIAVIGDGHDTCVTKTFCNSLRSLYYCEVCYMWIDTIFNYIQHRKSPRHKRSETVLKKSYRKKIYGIGASTLEAHCYPKIEYDRYGKLLANDGPKHCSRNKKIVFDNCGEKPKAAHYYPKLEYDRYGKRLASDGPKDYKKNENIVSDSGEKAFKKLKTSTSAPKHNCESKCSKHHEDLSQFVQEKLHCIRNATIYKPSSLNFELGESKSHAPVLNLEDGECLSDSHNYDIEDTHDVDYDKEHYCELCDFLCYNSLHYGKHLIGNQHKRLRRLINRKDKVGVDIQECGTLGDSHALQYNCELCDVFNDDSQSYEFHLNSAMHKKNKWMLYVLNQRPI